MPKPKRNAEPTKRLRLTAGDLGHDPGLGVPDPSPVHAAAEPWRSRMREGRWEYDTGHRDYAAAAASGARRRRYLVLVFAKEVVLRDSGRPGDGQVLERMVQVLTHLDETRAKGRERS